MLPFWDHRPTQPLWPSLVPPGAELLLRVADEAADVRPDQRDPEPGRMIRLELQTKVR